MSPETDTIARIEICSVVDYWMEANEFADNVLFQTISLKGLAKVENKFFFSFCIEQLGDDRAAVAIWGSQVVIVGALNIDRYLSLNE